MFCARPKHQASSLVNLLEKWLHINISWYLDKKENRSNAAETEFVHKLGFSN